MIFNLPLAEQRAENPIFVFKRKAFLVYGVLQVRPLTNFVHLRQNKFEADIVNFAIRTKFATAVHTDQQMDTRTDMF